MIHNAESVAGVSPSPGQELAAFRLRRHLRGAFLVVFAAATVMAVACGGADGDGLNTGSAPDLEPTANAGAAAILVPMGDALDFELVTPHNGVFNLERLEGRPVLLNFWFPSCPPCREELPVLQAAFESHGDDVQFLGVQLPGLDSAEEAEEFLRELGVAYPAGPDPDGRIVRDYKIIGFPTTVFIDSEHNVVKKHTGILSPEAIESLISATVASGGQTVASGP